MCELAWDPIVENKDPAFPANKALSFKLHAVSPQLTPFPTDNFWIVEHSRGNEIWASHVVPSWEIKPQLEAVDIVLLGPSQAAAAMSDLEFHFVPVNDAATLKIIAVDPPGFSFQQ